MPKPVPNKQPRRVQLECGHELWLKANLPRKGDLCFCYKCDTYVNVGPTVGRMGKTYYPDYDWSCEGVKGRGFVGTCLVPDCGHEAEEKYDWYALRNRMIGHHLHEHTISSLISRAIIAPIPLAPVDSPPF